MLQSVAVCYGVLQCVAVDKGKRKEITEYSGKGVLHCVAECCSVLQSVAVCCRVLQCVAV